MSSDDNLSNEDDNHSISLGTMIVTVRQSMWPRVGVDLGHEAPAPGLYHGGDTGSHVANPDSLWAFVLDA